MALFEVRDLRVSFETKRGLVQAVRGVNFDIERGECVALVGESGCGKSVTARALVGLGSATGGVCDPASRILYKGEDVLSYSAAELRGYRGSGAAMIFQDAMTSLNPTMRIGRQIAEGFEIHEGLAKREANERAVEMLELVGIPDARHAARRYPHELSGGMCQRVVIACALACNPSLLVADEPTTALDVTVQAQILALIDGIRERRGTSVLLISHDMGVVAGLAQRVIVMYAGEVVELGSVDDVFYRTAHPYSQGLLACSPRVGFEHVERLTTIPGSPPELICPPYGCAFADRCPKATDVCRASVPSLGKVGEGHWVACHLSRAV